MTAVFNHPTSGLLSTALANVRGALESNDFRLNQQLPARDIAETITIAIQALEASTRNPKPRYFETVLCGACFFAPCETGEYMARFEKADSIEAGLFRAAVDVVPLDAAERVQGPRLYVIDSSPRYALFATNGGRELESVASGATVFFQGEDADAIQATMSQARDAEQKNMAGPANMVPHAAFDSMAGEYF